MIELTLPFPPSVNTIWRRVGTKTLLSEKGRKYRKSCMDHIYLQSLKATRLAHKMQVTVKLYPPDKRRRDIDNSLKAILDSLKHCGIIEDDFHIDAIHVTREHPIEGGEVSVFIEPMVAER